MTPRQLQNWILYPVRMAMYRSLRKLMRAMGILR